MEAREVTEQTEQKAVRYQCPICRSTAFVDFRGRRLEECKKCLSKARERAIVLVLRAMGFLDGGRIRALNLTPTKGIDGLLGKKFGNGYVPRPLGEDVDGYLDGLAGEAGDGYDIIVHTSLLERLPQPPLEVVSRLDAMLKPGSIHLFTAAIRGMETNEGGGLLLDEEERARRFGQPNRYRTLGAADFPRALATLRNQSNPKVPFRGRFSVEDLERWRIPAEDVRQVTSDSVFSYIAR